MKKPILAALTLLCFSGALAPDHFQDPGYLFHRDTGGKLLGLVPDYIKGAYAKPFVVPSDPEYAIQKRHSMSNVGDIETIWETYTGKGTKIAVIDDGFAVNHPEYKRSDGSSAILQESAYFFESNGGTYWGVKYYKDDPTCIDESWVDWTPEYPYEEWDTHGTNSSTSAMAPIGNGGGVGIAPEADLLALKVDMSFVSIAGAIEYAISQKVDVINLSLGAYAESFVDGFGDRQEGFAEIASYLEGPCQKAFDQGIIVIAAAGNEATDHPSYPASNSHVVGVGALDQNSSTTLAPFTNYNRATAQKENNVDILAPGFVHTAGIEGTKTNRRNVYHDTQGTSFSSPIVAGAAALWKQKNPTGTPSQFLTALQSSALNQGQFKTQPIDTTSFGGPGKTGASNIECGILDVGALMGLEVATTGLSLSANELHLSLGGGKTSAELQGILVPPNASNRLLRWEVDRPEIISLSATENQAGETLTVTAKGIGDAKITVSTADHHFSATCLVSVKEYIPATGFSLLDITGQNASTLMRGQTIELKPATIPSNSSNQDWILVSENENVATVDDKNIIHAKGLGETDIVALLYEGVKEITATYHVKVSMPENVGLIEVSLYDKGTLNNSQSTTAPSLNEVKNQIKVNGNPTPSALTGLTKDRAYLRDGGISIGSSKNAGSLSFTFDPAYQIMEANIIGAAIDNDPALTVNNQVATSGTWNIEGSPIENCKEMLVYDFAPTNTLDFKVLAKSRVAFYKIDLLYSLVKPTSITLDQKEVNLDLRTKPTATLKATFAPAGATGTIKFESSHPDVVSVKDGLLTALKKGEATITATLAEDPSIKDTCHVSVKEESPVSIEILGLEASYPFAKKVDTSTIKVNAVYSNGSKADITNLVALNPVKTDSLGEHQYVVTYLVDGKTLEAKALYRVTLKDASIGDSSTPTHQTISTKFTGQKWEDATNSWSSIKNGAGYANGGVQVTARETGASASTVLSYSGISKITVHYCTNASKGAGDIDITIGNNPTMKIDCTKAGGTSSRPLFFEFAEPLDGQVTIKVNCSANSIYVIGVDIECLGSGGGFDATPEQAAKAFARRFLALIKPSCDPSGLQSDLTAMRISYQELEREASFFTKETKAILQDSMDLEIAEMRSLYAMIARYNLGTDFLNLGISAPLNHFGYIAENRAFLYGAIGIVSLAFVGSFFLFTHKRKMRRKGE